MQNYNSQWTEALKGTLIGQLYEGAEIKAVTVDAPFVYVVKGDGDAIRCWVPETLRPVKEAAGFVLRPPPANAPGLGDKER